VAMFLAVNAEQQSLEDVAEPLTAQDPEARNADRADGAREIDLRDGRRSDSDDDYVGSSPIGSSMRRYH
jgi:hypothetical protein